MVNPHWIGTFEEFWWGPCDDLAQVRRILSLDPSKYKNGRLPFGLKPDKAREDLVNMEHTMEHDHAING